MLVVKGTDPQFESLSLFALECKATTSYAGANYFALAFSLRAKRDDKLIAYHIERKYGFGTLLVYEP